MNQTEQDNEFHLPPPQWLPPNYDVYNYDRVYFRSPYQAGAALYICSWVAQRWRYTYQT